MSLYQLPLALIGISARLSLCDSAGQFSLGYMLDATPASLDQTGTVTVSRDRIAIDGFSADGATCRDVAALALVWAIQQLSHELQATMERPGGGKSSVD